MPSAVNIDLSVIKKISCPQSVNDLLQLHVNCLGGSIEHVVMTTDVSTHEQARVESWSLETTSTKGKQSFVVATRSLSHNGAIQNSNFNRKLILPPAFCLSSLPSIGVDFGQGYN